jgi:hypothetical protein
MRRRITAKVWPQQNVVLIDEPMENNSETASLAKHATTDKLPKCVLGARKIANASKEIKIREFCRL